MSTQITHPISPTGRDARRRNESAYETTVNVMDLPSEHVAYQATTEAVHVIATGMDVLGAWLFEMGGTITVVDLPSGVSVWTLRSHTFSDSPKFPAIPVLVSVTQVTGESVMPEIRAAVRA